MRDRARPRASGGTLGANQIRWLRTNMKPFDEAWKAVQASDANARKIKSQLQPDLTQLHTAMDESSGVSLQRLRLVERRTRRRDPVSA